MKVLYDWLKEYGGEQFPDVDTLERLSTFHAFEIDEVEKRDTQYVLDVKVLPDRGADCLSHRGIAHEYAALAGIKLEKDPLKEAVSLEPQSPHLKISIDNTSLCDRFAVAHLTDITISPSPAWLSERLTALGQRSINNVVDATNYVMLAIGQPLHAYDADALTYTNEQYHMHVRGAEEGETITTLSNEERTLSHEHLLITDGHTRTPLALAGVKGGKHAEINEHTKHIIIEAGHFHPQTTRKTAQALKLPTDAAKRFENGIVPEMVSYGIRDVVALILEIAGGTCEGYAEHVSTYTHQTEVTCTHAHIESVLGTSISKEIIEDIFKRLNFTFSVHDTVWTVSAPFERTDICIPEDVIAEIGRVYGYEHIVSRIPTTQTTTEYNTRHYYSEKIRTHLVALGFSEVITSSFTKKDVITLQNALASDKSALRSSLMENIRAVLNKNISFTDLLGIPDIRVFEIGTVFTKTPDGKDVEEHTELAVGIRTKSQGYVAKDDSLLTETIHSLETVLGTTLHGTLENGIYTVNVTTLLSTLPHPTTYDAYVPAPEITYTPFSNYPFISRDIAVWVPEGTKASDIEILLRENANELLMRLTLFDEFTKDGRVSYAFRLIFQSFERTLTDDEINVVMEHIYTVVKEKGFEVR